MFRMFDRRLSEKEIVHDEMLQNIPSWNSEKHVGALKPLSGQLEFYIRTWFLKWN